MKFVILTHQNLVRLTIISIITLNCIFSYTQTDTIKRIIFIPHPRSENTTYQCSLPAIEKIDFSKFDMTLLGGDLAYYTTIDRISMNHLDSIYDFGSENTLWTMGNHDLSNPSLITEYTHRPRSYAYFTDHITFAVLDAENGSSGFTSSHITADQVSMLQNVADTISQTKYLILLHGRLLWMIGNDDFSSRLDSVAESTKQLDTSNFNTVVFPILQQVKNRGVQVLCLGGDKSKINIQYSPEDSITYIASTMAPEFTDDVNNVVILTQYLNNDSLSWIFLPLSDVEKKSSVSLNQDFESNENQLKIFTNNESNELIIHFNKPNKSQIQLTLFDIAGRYIHSEMLHSGIINYSETISKKGVIILKLESDGFVKTKKLIFN